MWIRDEIGLRFLIAIREREWEESPGGYFYPPGSAACKPWRWPIGKAINLL
jgi:hypothetical protein